MVSAMDGLPIRLSTVSHETIATIVNEHGNAVYQLALRITGSREDAEDVVQETFCKLFQDCLRLPSRRNLAAWIRRVAANAAIDHLRRRKARAAREQPMDSPAVDNLPPPPSRDPSQILEHEEALQRLESAVHDLAPQQAACLVLSDHEGLSTREIAENLDIDPVTVRSYLCQARARLREWMRPYFAGVR